MADYQGGYECDFIEVPLDSYMCLICKNVLCDPQYLACCGQHCCNSCLHNWFQSCCNVSCPHCRAKGEDFQYNNNESLKQKILALNVKCTNHQKGCEWTGELGLLKDHLESSDGCGYVEVECPNRCYKVLWNQQKKLIRKMNRKILSSHLENDCFNRDYSCEHCGRKETYIQITGYAYTSRMKCYHYQQCPEMFVDCPNQCGVDKFKRRDIDNHRDECPLEVIGCPNKCKTKVDGKPRGKHTKLYRKNLDSHLRDKCYLRPYTCKYCSLESTYQAITGNGIQKQQTNHYDNCPEYPLSCPRQCGTTQIKRKNMRYHCIRCPEETVTCTNGCPDHVKRKHLKEHTTEKCPLRPYKCEHCSMRDTYTAIQHHFSTCHKYPMECPNKCGAEGITRDSVTSHCNHCPMQPIECQYAYVGCKAKLVRRDLEKHDSSMQQQHTAMMIGTFKKMELEHQQELEKTRDELRETKNELAQTRLELEQTSKFKVRTEIMQTKKTERKLRQTETELKRELQLTKNELRETKQDLTQVKQKVRKVRYQTKRKLKKARTELKSLKSRLTQTEQMLTQVTVHLLMDKFVHRILSGSGQSQDDSDTDISREIPEHSSSDTSGSHQSQDDNDTDVPWEIPEHSSSDDPEFGNTYEDDYDYDYYAGYNFYYRF